MLNIAKAGFTHTQWIHDWDGEHLYSRFRPCNLQCCHDFYYFLRKYHTRLYATHLQENRGIDPALNSDDAEAPAHKAEG